MSDDLLERNIDTIFAALDTDADGVITADDLTAIGTLACEQLRITGSAQATAILDGYASWWEQLRADCDADGDGRISREEFQAAFAQVFLSGDQAHPGTSILSHRPGLCHAPESAERRPVAAQVPGERLHVPRGVGELENAGLNELAEFAVVCGRWEHGFPRKRGSTGRQAPEHVAGWGNAVRGLLRS